MRGFFISIEGIDGAGKSTHIEPLAEWLRARGRHVQITREPGGTPLAEALRELLLHRPMDALTEVLLAFAARRDHLQQCIEPALAQGAVVLCDRFTDATFAYQGGGRGENWQLLSYLEQTIQHSRRPDADFLLQPDMTLWFDLPAAEAARRLAGARLPDRFEAEPLAFFERVAAAYARRQTEAPERIVRIDASQSLLAVREAVFAEVAGRLGFS